MISTVAEVREKLWDLQDALKNPAAWECTVAAIHALEPTSQRTTILWVIPMLRDMGYRVACNGQTDQADKLRGAACVLDDILAANPGRVWFD